MARQPWLAQLQSSRCSSEQIVALRALKNEIVGHPPKKAVVVNMGILEPVVRMSSSKSASREDGKSHDHSFASIPLSEEQMVRLQALQVIASIAWGQQPPYLLLALEHR